MSKLSPLLTILLLAAACGKHSGNSGSNDSSSSSETGTSSRPVFSTTGEVPKKEDEKKSPESPPPPPTSPPQAVAKKSEPAPKSTKVSPAPSAQPAPIRPKARSSAPETSSSPSGIENLYRTASVSCENPQDCNASVAALYFVDSFEMKKSKWSASWSVCTGSVVESTTDRIVIMTNRHCLSDKSLSSQLCPQSIAVFPDGTRIRCQRLLWIGSTMARGKRDIAFLEYTSAPHISALPFVVGSDLADRDHFTRRGYLFTFRSGQLQRALQESHRCTRDRSASSHSYESNPTVTCDRGTIGGFSGSPMFVGAKIVGAHNASYDTVGETERSTKQAFVSFECVRGIRSYENGFEWSLAPGCQNGPL